MFNHTVQYLCIENIEKHKHVCLSECSEMRQEYGRFPIKGFNTFQKLSHKQN